MFTEIIVTILASYLAFTNTMANHISAWLPTDAPSEVTEQSTSADLTPVELPSQYQNDSIPRILLDNLQYQGASVLESQDTETIYTTDPREALVNIYCTYTTDSSIRTTTGTGFFVNPDGVILTNAHVAQFLLLEPVRDTGETECIIRSGDPAEPRYRADLLYIPPAWIQEHAHSILEDTPIGTGERDYALLYVRESISRTPMPARFPALASDTELLRRGAIESDVIAAGYPVPDEDRSAIETELRPMYATTTISSLYTFDSTYADVISLRGSSVGAHGSSGGPILNDQGEVIGLITTRGNDSIDGSGSLRAITLSYIDRTIQEETGFTFSKNTAGNIPYRAELFTQTLSPFLRTMLSREL